jgi:hypothetical protein
MGINSKFFLAYIFLLFISKNSYSQTNVSANKWMYTVTYSSKLSELPDSILSKDLKIKAELNTTKKICLYFTLYSFEVNSNLYITFEYDSLFSNTNKNIDEENLIKQKGCFQVNFIKKTFTGNSIFKLNESLTFNGDTSIRNTKYCIYLFKKLKLFSTKELISVENNFLTGNSDKILVGNGSTEYEIKLLSKKTNFNYLNRLAQFDNVNIPLSQMQKGILDFLIF